MDLILGALNYKIIDELSVPANCLCPDSSICPHEVLWSYAGDKSGEVASKESA